VPREQDGRGRAQHEQRRRDGRDPHGRPS
jgi:hypothetical protein